MAFKKITMEYLDLLFGPGPEMDPIERARNSKKVFVLGLDQIATDSTEAKWPRINALGALMYYGLNGLENVARDGCAHASTNYLYLYLKNKKDTK